jgi:hypothetical protein
MYFSSVLNTINYYCAGDKIEKNEMGGPYRSEGGEERRGVYRDWVGKPEGKRPMERPRRR